MNRDAIPNIKSSVVGIGLISETTNQVRVFGSGFVINPNEYVLTATHVISDALNLQQKLKNKEVTHLTMIDYQPESDNTFRLISAPIGDNYRFLGLKPSFESEGNDLDVALLRPIEQKSNHSFLPVSDRQNFSTLEEVYLCGYPGGNFSFRLGTHPANVMLSPVLQLGRISSLMPADDAPKHQGIVTDIIGVGGSSGSPILDSNSGEVIGMAQQVIPGSLYNASTKYTQRLYHTDTETGKLTEKEIESTSPTKGYVNEGIVFGFSSIMFSFVISNFKEILEEKVDLSQFEINYTMQKYLN